MTKSFEKWRNAGVASSTKVRGIPRPELASDLVERDELQQMCIDLIFFSNRV